MSWNPQQYLKFEQPRLRPAFDLLNRLSCEPQRIYDLGCGTGNLTRLLAERWPSAQVTGVDDSAEMLARAAETPSSIHWVQQSLANWQPTRRADLIFSNAALHWLPDHARVFARLVDALEPGGVLAVQMPRNFQAPSHTLIDETVRNGPWRNRLEGMMVSSPVAEPEFYYRLLEGYAAALDIWETEYLHVLEGNDAVKEWTKGTWLKRFLDALEQPERSAFEDAYAARVKRAYSILDSGRTLFPFRRLFLVMQKK